MPNRTLLVSTADHITTVTLNRPDKLNALSLELADELYDALHAADQDDNTRVIVLTGAGRAFSAGADLKPGPDAAAPRATNAPTLAERLYQALFDIEKPIIASINGVAVGGGCTMTFLCDIRIASENARFQLPFTKLGICAELGSTFHLPRLVGAGKAAELVLTSRMVEAKEAAEIGLVNHVVPSDELASRTRALAESIAKHPPLSVRLNKKGLRLGLSADAESQFRFENLAIARLNTTEDAAEARAAFREKRDPVFTGR